MDNSKMNKWLIVVVGVIVVAVVLLFVFGSGLGTTTISYNEFVAKTEAGKITKITLNGYAITAIGVNDEDKKVTYSTVCPHPLQFAEKMQQWTDELNGFPNATTLNSELKMYNTDPAAGEMWGNIIWIILIVLAVAVMFFMLRQVREGGNKAHSFSKSRANLVQGKQLKFSDIAGSEEEKEELREIVDFLRAPKKFSALGARTPKGVLLVGLPGTGKTMFAKAVAGEASVPFFSISGSDFVELYVGVGASRVRDLFDVAKKSSPCIVFIDEIDAVGRQRGTGMGGGNDEREQTLNQLLVQMDGFETNTEIIVMAATNRADVLDPALLRPGRFDRQIYISLPDVREREAILKVHARNKPIGADVNFKTIARITAGLSGADLENILNEAAILAARENSTVITAAHMNEGFNKAVMGPKKKSKLVTESDKRITAYHEAGHAVVAGLLPNLEKVHEVTIIPRGQMGGYTLSLPENDDNYFTRGKLFAELKMLLGGRVAEEVVIKDITAGAISDIERASTIARNMVAKWGMSEKLGPISYASSQEVFLGRDYTTHNTYSEETANIIDSEVKRFIDKAHKETLELVTENKEKLENLARLLIERETIFEEEFEMIMKGDSVEKIIKYMDKKDGVKEVKKEQAIAEEKTDTKEQN